MSRDIGKWLQRRISILKNWREFVKKVVAIIKEIVPSVEVYVFGSVVSGEITGSSDIDVLVVVPDEVNLRKVHLDIVLKLEDVLGEDSYILDIHVVKKCDVDKPPYVWWLRKAVKIS